VLNQTFIQELVERLLAGISPDLYLVAIQVAEGRKITILADADRGIEIHECSKLNRRLREALEPYPDINELYEIEVSSPGIGYPLMLPRQYRRHVGRRLRLDLLDGTTLEGKLLTTDDQTLQLETQVKTKGRKTEPQQHQVALAQVKEARVQVSFD